MIDNQYVKFYKASYKSGLNIETKIAKNERFSLCAITVF